jgi:hypothetical protein
VEAVFVLVEPSTWGTKVVRPSLVSLALPVVKVREVGGLRGQSPLLLSGAV